MKNNLMTHVVAGYPTKATCIDLLIGMQKAGVTAIEIQIPFSDPGADGPVIMRANDTALENGMTTLRCFHMIDKARTAGLNTPIYLMTYLNKVISFGLPEFCKRAHISQITGFIVPDLPIDSAEYDELKKQCTLLGIAIVPVLSPGISANRLDMYLRDSHGLIYLTSTKGITGKKLTIKKELRELVKIVRTKTTCTVALGFGIRDLADVEAALSIVDIAVLGSAIIRSLNTTGIKNSLRFIEQLVGEK